MIDEAETALLKRFKEDLLRLALRDDYQASPHVVITGLLETAAVLMGNGVLLEPAAAPVLLTQIDNVRAVVEAVARRAQPPDPPTQH
jgi:hypothetical protein